MFPDYEYFNERKERFGLKAVYRVESVFRLTELVKDIRNIEFPCMAVEINNDGVLDILTGNFDHSYHQFFILTQVNAPEALADPGAVHQAIIAAGQIGKQVLRLMRNESADIKSPCYGFDASNIPYSKIGPVGMQCYGCSFQFTMRRDHVDE